VVERKDVDEEEVKVKIVDNTVKKISKRVPLDEADAEFVGILKFSAFSASRYLDLLEHAISVDKKYNMYFDDVIEELAQDVNVYTMDIGELPCMEIDTEDDLNRACLSVWPKIIGNLHE
jgi:choline kinase